MKKILKLICITASVALIAVSLKMIIDSPLMASEYINNRFEWIRGTHMVTEEDYNGNEVEKEETYMYLHAKVLFHNNYEFDSSVISNYNSGNLLIYEYLTNAYRTVGAVIGGFGIVLFGIPLYTVLKKE